MLEKFFDENNFDDIPEEISEDIVGVEIGPIEDVTLNEEETSYEEAIKKNKVLNFFATSKKFYFVMTLLCAVLLAGTMYYKHTTFLPDDRVLLEDNIYSGNNLAISSQEVEDIVSNLEKVLGVSICEDSYDSYCLLNAIYDNPNLSDSEKDIFYKVISLVEDNPYIDKEHAYKSLLNVDVLYKRRPFSIENDIEGMYIHKYESIGIFEDDPDNRILIHEIIHCIFANVNTENLPDYFSEGVTELLANEYFSDKPFVELMNYPFEIAMVKMLCEVTSPDVVLKAYSTGDMDVIAEDIARYTDDIDGARKALEMFDYTIRRFKGDLRDDEKYIEDRNEIINGYIPLFRAIVEHKYAPEDHSRVSYFYNEILIANIFSDDPYNDYVDDLVEFGADCKAYFSNELKRSIGKNGVMKNIVSGTYDDDKIRRS